MKIAIRLLLVLAVIALGFWLWTILFPSPEKLIRKRITEVARLASFSQGEGLVPQGLRIQGLANCFAPTIEIAIDVPGSQRHELAGRDEIVQTAGLARQTLRWLKVELLDPTVVVSADKESAVVNLTLRARSSEQKDLTVQELKVMLKKTERQWQIIRIETVRTLSRLRTGESLAACLTLNPDLDRNLNLSRQLHGQIKSKIKITSAAAHHLV